MPSNRKYRPSNGTEGEGFIGEFCERCIHDAAARRGDYEHGCQILARSLMHDVDDPEYPSEWIWDWQNRPTCTAFLPDNEVGEHP